jgi:hypothetical protein
MEEESTNILQKNRNNLDALANALLETETLEEPDIDAIISQEDAGDDDNGGEESKVLCLNNFSVDD